MTPPVTNTKSWIGTERKLAPPPGASMRPYTSCRACVATAASVSARTRFVSRSSNALSSNTDAPTSTTANVNAVISATRTRTDAVARRTPGFTGADLANVLNEAALLTARQNAQIIDDHALDEAIDRVVAGPQKRTRVMNTKEVKITAYHEGGHALVAAALRYTDPVTKVTILPRGRALGYTMVMPTEDKYSTTRNELLDQLAYAMGGRVAEELVFHDPTTGASNDIDKATETARKMVTQYGMSEVIGAVKLGQDSGEVFMGRDMGHGRDYSESVATSVDIEVRRLVDAAHDEAWAILVEYRDVLDRLVLELLERETLNQSELVEIFAPVVKRPPRDVWLSSVERAVSSRPPVMTPTELADLASAASQNGHIEIAPEPTEQA